MTDQFFGITDPGKQRQNNEDTFIAEENTGGRFIIAAVIDGVGGYEGGEIAAELARETFLKQLQNPKEDLITVLSNCFASANDRILQEKQVNSDYSNMACVATLAVADVANNQFYYAHVGDTRLYLLRDNSLVKISHDQSFVGFLEDSGRLTEDAAMDHPKRNEISKALGFERSLSNNADYIETGQSPFLSGDMLLLCSDGLTDLVNSKTITEILSQPVSLADKAKQLVDAANQNGGKDNITVVLVKNDKSPVKHAAITPKITEPKIAKQQPLVPEPLIVKTKSGKGVITLLSVLLLLFIGISIYLFTQTKGVDKPVITTAIVAKGPNKQEVKLQHAIDNLKGHVLLLTDTAYTSPIIISRVININADSLIIKAKGNITLQCDSGYHGVAIQVSPKSKNLSLDSLSFNGFDTALAVQNANLSLKNVRFIQCKQSVQNNISLTDKKYNTGKIQSLVFKVDSLPLKSK